MAEKRLEEFKPIITNEFDIEIIQHGNFCKNLLKNLIDRNSEEVKIMIKF